MSLAEWLQFMGRMLRKKTEPALIFDRVNNYKEHGLPCAEREWTLEDRKQGKRDKERVQPTRQCDECFHIHRPSPVCPECGYVYTVKSRTIDEVDGELQEVDKEAIKLEKKKERQKQGQEKTLDDLVALGKQRGYKNPYAWAVKVFSGRMNKR